MVDNYYPINYNLTMLVMMLTIFSTKLFFQGDLYV
jgi:hypothetical protein